MKIRMLPFGIAAERFAAESKKATLCEARVTEQCWDGPRGRNAVLGDHCGWLAKVEIDGVKVCIKHAGAITLREALKRAKR